MDIESFYLPCMCLTIYISIHIRYCHRHIFVRAMTNPIVDFRSLLSFALILSHSSFGPVFLAPSSLFLTSQCGVDSSADCPASVWGE